MDSAVAATKSALDTRTLLARVNQRIALLRSWLSHDHGDEPYWWARKTTAPRAQYERVVLRHIANLLHIERASRRGRLHGTRFADLDEQRGWLEHNAAWQWSAAADFIQVPSYASLALLRDGKLPL